MTDLAALLDPEEAALVTSEVQVGVVGAGAVFPALAEAAADTDLVPTVASLCEAARAVAVPVVHGCAAHRPDRRGGNANAPLFRAAAASDLTLAPGSDAAAVVDPLGPADEDLVLTRLHGLSPMARTGLDPVLRNLGVGTLVVTGVSVNVAVTNLVMDSVNAGYRVVVVRDAVAGTPPEYAEAVVEHTLSLLATVVTAAEIRERWSGDA